MEIGEELVYRKDECIIKRLKTCYKITHLLHHELSPIKTISMNDAMKVADLLHKDYIIKELYPIPDWMYEGG